MLLADFVSRGPIELENTTVLLPHPHPLQPPSLELLATFDMEYLINVPDFLSGHGYSASFAAPEWLCLRYVLDW